MCRNHISVFLVIIISTIGIYFTALQSQLNLNSER